MDGKDQIGDRMKTYEDAYRAHLPIRLPVICRIDGRSFHRYLRDCQKPIDLGLIECMNDTAIALCEEVQGCKLAYVQSDEISLLLTNYDTLDTQSWFDNNLQKMVSISAAVASVTFTQSSWKIWAPKTWKDVDPSSDPMSNCDFVRPAHFDARAFVLPKEEVCNYFLWRQKDCERNSVQMLARSLYSHKQCHDKNNSELQEMCFQKGTNWNDLATFQKRGRCIVRKEVAQDSLNPKTQEVVSAIRHVWTVDNEIPIFTQDRLYIEKHVYPLRVVQVP